MSVANPIQWVKDRLPANARFSKHGQVVTVDEAVTRALVDNDNSHRLALADLLETLAADVVWQSESGDGYSTSGELLTERAKAQRAAAASEINAQIAGSFESVDANYRRPTSISDEYSQ